MQDKKQNKLISDKLAGLDQVPEGVSFNPAAAWQKLETALHPVQKKKPIAWYYAAAVLFLSFFSWLLFSNGKHENDQPLAKEKQAQQPKDKISNSPVTTALPQKNEQQSQSENTATIPVQQVHDPVKKENAASLKPARVEEEKLTPVAETLASSTVTVQPVVIAQPKPQTPVAATTIKPKLKVMHINEMGNPVLLMEEKNTVSNNSMLIFSRPSAMPEQQSAEEDNAVPAKKKTIFKAVSLQINQ